MQHIPAKSMVVWYTAAFSLMVHVPLCELVITLA